MSHGSNLSAPRESWQQGKWRFEEGLGYFQKVTHDIWWWEAGVRFVRDAEIEEMLRRATIVAPASRMRLRAALPMSSYSRIALATT